MTLAEVNALARERFVAAFGDIFEQSAWVAETAAGRRPFSSLEALHAAMLEVVQRASMEERLALIRAHPELAGRDASQSTLSADSASEQNRLGFGALSREEFERISDLNRRYRGRFGFPCIVALRMHASRDSVLGEMERRLANDRDAEIAAALEQIGHITRGRLDKLIAP